MKDAAADVGVGVRRAVVVDVEEPVVPVLVIVATDVEARARSVIVPVIARRPAKPHGTARIAPVKRLLWICLYLFAYLFLVNGFLRMRRGGGIPLVLPLSGKFQEAAADVGAGVRRAAVDDVEEPVVPVLAIVATDAEARARSVIVPAIARIRRITA